MRGLFFLCIVLCASLFTHAQTAPTYEWIKSDSSQMRDVCFHDNHLYSIGNRLTKWDTLGNKVWEMPQFSGHKIKIDNNHNILILSTLPSAGGTFGSTTLTSAGGDDILILKIDTSGSLIWAKNYGNALNDYANEICVDYNNSFYLNCRINTTYYNYINKYSSNGLLAWSKPLIDSNHYSSNSFSRHIQYSEVDSTILVSGLFRISLTVDNQNITTYPHFSFGHGTDLYLLKLNETNGSRIYLKNMTQTSRSEHTHSELYVNPNNGNIVFNHNTFALSGDQIRIREYNPSASTLLGYIEQDYGYLGGFKDFSSNGIARSYRSNISSYQMKIKDAQNNLLFHFDLNPNIPRGPFVYGANALYIPFYTAGGTNSTYFAKIGLPPCALNTSYSASSVSICANQLPYAFNGQSLTTSGTYYDTLINSTGCDSIITLNLTVNSATSNTIHQTICDSLLFSNQFLTASGTYYDTLINSSGCDSIITLNLTISSSSLNTINQTVCDSFIFNGQTLSTSGTYYDTLINSTTCDSIIELHLLVSAPSNIKANSMPNQSPLMLCFGDTVVLYGSGGSSYAWNNSISNNVPFVPTISGFYTVTGTDSNNCSAQDSLWVGVSGTNPTIVQSNDTLFCQGTYNIFYYNWLLNGNAIGVNSDYIKINQSGQYVIQVTDSFQCVGYDTLNVIGVGIDEISNGRNDLFVYPNPVYSKLYIKTKSKAVRVLYNGVGQILISTYDNELDVSGLSRGVYYLRCGDEVRKVLVE